MVALPFAELLRPELGELSPYSPHAGTYPVRLDANEAPTPFSEAARARLSAAAAEAALERYPDAGLVELRRALAARSGVSADAVIAGVGSDELITLLLTAFSVPRRGAEAPVVLTTTPTFVMYAMSARVRGQRVLEVPLDERWDLDERAFLDALREHRPGLAFIASPNNPTGNLMDGARLERAIAAAPDTLFVIDEAYIDYSDRDQLDLHRRYENVAVLRTLSKIGLAALRVGWLVARPELVRELDKVRLPYNLPTLSQRLAVVATTELATELAAGTARVVAERQRLAERLARLPGVAVTPSQANFLWVGCERRAEALFDGLRARGVLVRSFHKRGGRLGQQLRVTIGTPSENDAFYAAYEALVS
ncbi:MAG TPA: histidinol-phosphate transaminase [Polyangiaceae bacterium]|nr:histidinol-phosphate transaminase [Polyangiaceae bacterium]